MGVNWTKEQQRVIDSRNRNILVSAAAGSGKTAVLVERIIKILTDEENPVDVDRLLIVTFTEAAASEMKERILNAIEKALEENPDNVHLQKQATLIHSALITTIHSFCLSVIREHFHAINIDPGFRIAEEGELTLIKQDVLENLLEDFYVEGDKDFIEFTEKYSTGRNDKNIEELILKLYDYSRSYPLPEKWLDECLLMYNNIDEDDKFISMILKSAKNKCEDMKLILDECMEICEMSAGPYMYADAIEDDMALVEKLVKCNTFSEYFEALSNIKWKRLSTKKDESVYEELKDKVKKLRESVKKTVKDLKEKYFYSSLDEIKVEMNNASVSVGVLINLVKEFGVRLADKKQEKNIIDFGDMEQFALKILNDNNDGELVPSVVAKEYQDRFYEVMIDEYQDSNFIQETILTSVSKVSRGQHNIFMVGDVKQSIYRFRLSRPELFMEKYDTYTLDESDEQRIDLDKNFRSREEVLHSVNFIFSQIMRKGLGNVEYDRAAYLNPGASFEQQIDENGENINKAELLFIEKNPDEDSVETEAGVIANRILQLMESGKVLDKKTGEYRKPMFKDIVILIRAKSVAPTFSKVLGDYGIPVYFGSTEGYFETYEVSVLLDYLKVLDNYRQDIPLAAVLTSMFAGLKAHELGIIKEAFPDICYYDAVKRYISYAEENGNTEDLIYKKLKSFMETLMHYRSIVPFTPIDKLLTYIIEETGYGVYVSAMPGGEVRSANVDMLVEKAIAFEKTSYKGLFNFVRYINQIRKYDIDYGEAGIDNEQSNTVKLMTIHKSKGLEFPIVFVSAMGRKFNTSDQKSSMVIHPTLGVGLDSIDLEKRTKAPVILKKLIQEETLKENLGEELRVLYVALTRAKEKLIMTGVMKDAKDKVVEESSNGTTDNTPLGYYILSSATCYLDWLLPLVGRVSDDVPLDIQIMLKINNDEDADIVNVETNEFTEDDTKAVSSYNKGDTGENTQENNIEEVCDARTIDINRVYNEEFNEKLKSELGFVYPYMSDSRCKMKFTVSELKKMQYENEVFEEIIQKSEESMFDVDNMEHIVPEFMKKSKGLVGAGRGTAYHRFMELHDFTKAGDYKTLNSEMDTFVKEGFMSKEMADAIFIKDIELFLKSKCGIRMSEATIKGNLKKEQPFIISMDADSIYEELKGSGEKILVQGVIDVCFIEDKEAVVLDYKTDNVDTMEELVTRYHAQLDYYGMAVEKLTGIKVKEKIIYSFRLNDFVTIE